MRKAECIDLMESLYGHRSTCLLVGLGMMWQFPLWLDGKPFKEWAKFKD